MPDKPKNQKGVTLLLAMLIMTAVVGVAISLSVLIVRQFELSANLDHSLVALYAAESGLENGLSIIKENRNDVTKDITDADSSLDISDVSLDILTTANWTSSGSVDEYYLSDSLNQNQSLSLDLKKAGSIELTWDDDCEKASWLKIGFVAWDDTDDTTDPILVGPVPPSFFKDGEGEEPWPLVACSEGDCSVIKNFPSSDYNYTLTITPIACNVSNLKIKAYSGADKAGTQLSIGNRINLKSVGKYQGSQIAVSANLPYRLPPQGIFNFAIFSESTLEKK